MAKGTQPGQLAGGIVAIVVGGLIVVLVIAHPSGMAPGVRPWVGVAAGAVFLLAGALIVLGSRPGAATDGLPMRVPVESN